MDGTRAQLLSSIVRIYQQLLSKREGCGMIIDAAIRLHNERIIRVLAADAINNRRFARDENSLRFRQVFEGGEPKDTTYHGYFSDLGLSCKMYR